MRSESDDLWLVDDNEADNFLHKLVLRRTGWKGSINVFERPEHALAAALDETRSPPAVVLLDVNMPGMSGWEWLAAVAEAAPDILQRTRIHVLTTSIDKVDLERAKAVPGLAGFIEKPLSDSDVGRL